MLMFSKTTLLSKAFGKINLFRKGECPKLEIGFAQETLSGTFYRNENFDRLSIQAQPENRNAFCLKQTHQRHFQQICCVLYCKSHFYV